MRPDIELELMKTKAELILMRAAAQDLKRQLLDADPAAVKMAFNQGIQTAAEFVAKADNACCGCSSPQRDWSEAILNLKVGV